MRAIPTAAPMKDDSRIASGSICQPHHAPIAASSLKSPNPIPSLPVASLNSQYTLHRARYPAAAPITAERRSVKVPPILTSSPSHSSGRVIESGSSCVSKSMKLAAMMHQTNTIAASFIDFDTQLLPDSITLPLLWLGLLVNAGGLFPDLRSAVIGAAAGYLALWSVYWLFKLATGKEGMGFGDFKLLAAIGAWCGWQMLPLAILLSSFIGAAVGIALMVFARHGRSVPIPFGPYLGAAGIVALFWGPQLTRQYLSQFM